MPFALRQPLSLADCIRVAGVAAEISGDAARLIRGVGGLEEAGPGELCFCNAEVEEAVRMVATCGSDAVIVRDGFPAATVGAARSLVRTRDPMLLFVRCVEKLFAPSRAAGVSPGAMVHPEASIGEGTAIGAFTVIERGCQLGRNVNVGPNTVIGGSGLAYARNEAGEYAHFPHLGRVIVEDDVDIGSGCAIVRGILQNTAIGRGTKIGNLVNIGHNVSVGRNCFLSSGVTLCGSVRIGDDCWIAAGVVILNHVRVGRGATVSLGAVVNRDVAPGATVAGFPARTLAQTSR